MVCVRLVLIVCVACAGLACSADGSSPGRPRPGGDGGTGPGGGESSHADCGDGLDNDGDGLGDCADPDCAVWAECGGPGPSDAGPGADSGLEECASVVGAAMPTYAPVDIIWAIDNSGSMSEEAGIVQSNINNFATDIFASGVNYRVIVITAAGYVTVADPLGSDTMHFRRIDASIGSHEAFEVLLATFPSYSDFLRPDAVTHIVGVTDDESDMREGDFRSQMESRLGHSFIFHAVASEEAEHDCTDIPLLGRICDPGCEGPHGDAADVGARYYSLAMMTGGTTFSICTGDWSPLFATLRDSVVISASLPCFYALPAPPAGETFNPAEVNVVFTSSGGGEESFPRAIDPSRCTDSAGAPVRAWYYDDNDAPTQILLCPAACDLVESDTAGRMNIALGCETEMVLI